MSVSGKQPSNERPYGEAVPAILRALDVIEHLRAAPRGLSLSEISRALGVSPSSMLAILRTLVSRGYVERVEATGAYRLGSAQTRLAQEDVAAQAVRQAAEAVSSLAQAIITAAPLGGAPERQHEVLSALGMASRHLSGLLLDHADAPTRPATGVEPVWQAGASGPLGPAELDEFLAGGWVATLSCLKDNGYPYSVPVWYHWERSRFWVVPRARAEWARYLERNPRVSLAVSESSPPFRRVLVEGNAQALTNAQAEDRAHELTMLMATRYLGPAAASYLEATASQLYRVFAIVPEKLVTWHGLASHPRYQSVHSESVSDQGIA